VIFTHSFRGITGVDAASGKQLWEIDVFGRHKQRAIGSPVLAGDLVIGSSGFTTSEKNVVAVRPGGGNADSAVQEVYRLQKNVPHVPTPLVFEGRLYLLTDNGILTTADAATGEVFWSKRVGGNFHGSPICAGGRLYAIDLTGVVVVLATGPDFEVLARNDLGEPGQSTPAVSGGVLYLRTLSHLIALGGQ
jgi:outer membrane protein assembly factor BamB